MGCLTIKGNNEGLVAYINSGDYNSIKDELMEKIEKSRGFFKGCNLYIIDKYSNIPLEAFDELKTTLKEVYDIEIKYNSKPLQDTNERVFSNIYEGRTKFFRNTIRSGQRIYYNGNIVVIGDVNSSAEIIATGNIIILGILRGIAHAGSNGNKKAFVAAYVMQPSLLRIADIIVRAPDGEIERPNIPEVAAIKDGTIIVEPYLPNKYL